MSRYARKKSKSGIFHVMMRGINKQTIFEDVEDRERFLATIERYKEMCKVDTGFVLQILSTDMKKAIDSLIKYTNEQNKDKCLDNDEKIRLSDNEVKKYFTELGIENTNELQHMEISMRNEMIRKLKLVEGTTIRQLSRLTGISKSVINRI